MSRRIVLTTVGSYGDVHPFIAVALALKARGVDVVLAAMEDYRAKVEAEGLTFRPVRPTLAQILNDTGLTSADIARSTMRPGGVPFLLKRKITPYLEDTYSDLLAAFETADVVVTSSFSVAAFAAAEAKRLPRASLLLSPITLFSRQDPPRILEMPWAPALQRLGRPGVETAHVLMRLGSRVVGRPTAKLRKRQGLDAVRGIELIDAPLEAAAVICL
jgi:rhamnosyltransferase subunit B